MDTLRLLLVEDDATSRAVLADVLQRLPAVVDVARDCADARTIARAHAHDLWLLDVELPDGNGIALLAELRQHHPHCPALAHTASDDQALHARLAESGFVGVIRKPVAAGLLLARVRAALDTRHGHSGSADRQQRPAADHGITTITQRHADVTTAEVLHSLPDWDDAAATRALGSASHVPVLRAQFLASLPQESAAVEAACASGDPAALRAVLHRLRAACGFTGAARLDACVRALRAASTSAESSAALRAYRAACAALQAGA